MLNWFWCCHFCLPFRKNKSFRPRDRPKKGLKNLQTVKTLSAGQNLSNATMVKTRKQPLTVTAQFQNSLTALMDTLNQVIFPLIFDTLLEMCWMWTITVYVSPWVTLWPIRKEHSGFCLIYMRQVRLNLIKAYPFVSHPNCPRLNGSGHNV